MRSVLYLKCGPPEVHAYLWFLLHSEREGGGDQMEEGENEGLIRVE